MKSFLIYSSVFCLLISNFIYAQDDWKFSGQIQLRTEFDGRDFSNRTHPLTFASLRTRIGVEKTFLDKVNFFAQVQDSRVFGEEGNTLVSINNLDLHQGYVILRQLFDWNMDIQAGRFEVVYGTERFFGAVGWHYVGRAWDGVRFKFFPGFKLDFFALTHTESVPYIGNANPSVYPLPAEPSPSNSVYGFWSSENLTDRNQFDFFGYYQINRMKILSDLTLLERSTLGINHFGNYYPFLTTFEFAYQFGKAAGIDISAYLISVQMNYEKIPHKFELGTDILSGTEQGQTKFKSFDVSFGTNHKFYGYMDYFIYIPSNTNSLGLNDFYIGYQFQPSECYWSGNINIHYFLSNKKFQYGRVLIGRDGSLTEDKHENSTFGQEIDLSIKYNFIKGTAITWGGSIFFPGEIMKQIFSDQNGTREDISYWTYIMITANI